MYTPKELVEYSFYNASLRDTRKSTISRKIISSFGGSFFIHKKYLIYSLNSLKGDILGSIIWVIKEDIRSLDYGSCNHVIF